MFCKQFQLLNICYSFVPRGLFIIDDKGVLRQITMNDLPVSRISNSNINFYLSISLAKVGNLKFSNSFLPRLEDQLTRPCVWSRPFSIQINTVKCARRDGSLEATRSSQTPRRKRNTLKNKEKKRLKLINEEFKMKENLLLNFSC